MVDERARRILQDVIVFLGQREMGTVLAGEMLRDLNAPDDASAAAAVMDTGWILHQGGRHFSREIIMPGAGWMASVSAKGRRWWAIQHGDSAWETGGQGTATGVEDAQAKADAHLHFLGAPVKPQ